VNSCSALHVGPSELTGKPLKMFMKNANTRAQGGNHLLVLAHLRRRWSLSGREGLGPSLSLSPAELASAGFRHFRGVKMPIFTTPEVGKETEANEGHRGDRTLHQTRSWYDRTRPVSTTQQSGARVLGFATGASGHSRDRRIRSGA
jgi:hypothetical protein